MIADRHELYRSYQPVYGSATVELLYQTGVPTRFEGCRMTADLRAIAYENPRFAEHRENHDIKFSVIKDFLREEPGFSLNLAPPCPYAFKPYKFTDMGAIDRRFLYTWRAEDQIVPNARSGHRMIYDSGNLYSFGGYAEVLAGGVSRTLTYQELWKFNIANYDWSLVPSSGDVPTQVCSHTAVKDGSYMIVFGGTAAPFGASSTNQTHVVDLRTGVWKVLKTKGDKPPALYGHAAILVNDNLYTIGGTTGSAFFMDVYKLNVKSLEWAELCVANGDGTSPTPRYRHELAFDGKYIYVIGGGVATESFELNTIHGFDIENKVWKKFNTFPALDGQIPTARRSHGLAQLGDDVYISGGIQGRNSRLMDIWKLNLPTMAWTRLPVEMPSRLSFHATAITDAGRLFMFGGVVMDQVRTNAIHSVWLKVPSLKEMAWATLLSAYPRIGLKSKAAHQKEGIPPEFIERIDFDDGQLRIGN